MARARKITDSPSGADLRPRALRISAALRAEYPAMGTALRSESPFQLLVATILSAQCTDTRVNQVTPALFAKYPDAEAFAGADPTELESLIHSTGFYRQKAEAIIGSARMIVATHGGTMPESMEDLTALPGVGRKTAHVVRGNGLGLPAIFVDTHFKRLAGRMALSLHTDPVKIERDVAALLPETEWTDFSNAMIWHGRRICAARNPKCPQCVVREDCPTGRQRLGL